MSMIKKKPVEPIEQPKKKAFRTIRKEITLRAAGFGDRGERALAGRVVGFIGAGCEADGNWHDITASREVARHSPQRKTFFSDTDEDDDDAETIVTWRRCLGPGLVRVHGVSY